MDLSTNSQAEGSGFEPDRIFMNYFEFMYKL